MAVWRDLLLLLYFPPPALLPGQVGEAPNLYRAPCSCSTKRNRFFGGLFFHPRISAFRSSVATYRIQPLTVRTSPACRGSELPVMDIPNCSSIREEGKLCQIRESRSAAGGKLWPQRPRAPQGPRRVSLKTLLSDTRRRDALQKREVFITYPTCPYPSNLRLAPRSPMAPRTAPGHAPASSAASERESDPATKPPSFPFLQCSALCRALSFGRGRVQESEGSPKQLVIASPRAEKRLPSPSAVRCRPSPDVTGPGSERWAQLLEASESRKTTAAEAAGGRERAA